MRLRRETGDFQIKITENNGTFTANTIRAGLSAEDFIGETVKVGDIYEIIAKAVDGDGIVTADSVDYALEYTKATGEIQVVR